MKAARKTGRPALPPEEKMVTATVRLTPAQRDRLKRVGVRRLREWLERAKE